VENHREGKRTGQRVLSTLGRAGELAQSGGVDVLLKSLGRFATRVRVIEGYEQGRQEAGALRHIGPDLVFARLWKELELDAALNPLLQDRGWQGEWAGIRRDLLALTEVEVRDGDQWYLLPELFTKSA
jgi:hypothetical protein